jgi:hypothetical protein
MSKRKSTSTIDTVQTEPTALPAVPAESNRRAGCHPAVRGHTRGDPFSAEALTKKVSELLGRPSAPRSPFARPRPGPYSRSDPWGP